MAKLLLNCPTFDGKSYCLPEWAKAVRELTFSDMDILVADNSKTEEYSHQLKALGFEVIRTAWSKFARTRIVDARNELRKHFLNGTYDWFFSLEQDVLPPKDVIERLLAHEKKVISGIYLNPYETSDGIIKQPVLWKGTTEVEFEEAKEDPGFQDFLVNEKITSYTDIMRKFSLDEMKGEQLLKVKACGMGCLLIHREILSKVEFRYDPEKVAFDDVFFCKDVDKKGYPIYADTAVKCRHAIKGGQWKHLLK